MSKVIKVTGLVEEPRQGNAARVRVLSYKKGQIYITDSNQIVDEFPPYGFVFIRNILDRYPVGTLVNVRVTFHEPHPSNDNYTGNGYSPEDCRPTGYRFFHVSKRILLNPFSISLNYLKAEIPKDISLMEFYVAIGNQVYGPFNYESDTINAHAEVDLAELDPQIAVSSSGFHYFLMKPTAIRKIDAMNPERLSTWFKQKIKMLTTMPNIGDAVKVLQESDFAGPDSGRLRRCMEALNQLHIGREELSRLATVTPNLDAIFQQAIQKAWAEFTRPALEEAEQVQSSVIRQQAQLAALTQELGNAQDQKCELQADIAHWESERERLIRDIRLNSLFGQISRSHLEKFEIISYRVVKASNYSDYTAFVEHFCKTLNLSDVQDRQNAFIAPGQLKSYKAILAPQVEFVLHLAGVTRNAVVILQHAEADWLKFDHFYENGLKTAVDQANANPSSFTFLVIQNFNLSAIECYAAPLLDLLNGVRRKLPGVGQPLPNNLWLFFIPIVQEPETPFGLPLMKHTYRKWGAFARLEGIQVPSVSDGPVLTLEQMTSHSMPVQTNFKEFFNE